MRYAIVIWLAGCAAAPVSMRTTPPHVIVGDADHAIVMFVHPGDPRVAACATQEGCLPAPPGWHDAGSPTLRLVDERARWLGDSSADTIVTATFDPGEHVLVGWVGGERETCAMHVQLEAGRIYYVEVRSRTLRGPGGGGHGGSAAYDTTWGLHPIHRSSGPDRAMLVRGMAWIELIADPWQLAGNLGVDAHVRRALSETRGTGFELSAGDGFELSPG
jgi:hypothetical protein